MARHSATVLARFALAMMLFGSVSATAVASPAAPAPAPGATFNQDDWSTDASWDDSGSTDVAWADDGSADAGYAQDGNSVWVPTYMQQRNLSCEYAAAVIAMAGFGVWVNEYDFDGMVGWSDNPHWGYRGNITGWWGNTDDYGVYASALAPAIRNFGFWAEEFYAQGDFAALTNRIDAGSPVIVWLGLWGDTSFYDYTSDGSRYKLASGMHVVVAYGYDSGGVWVSDPAHGTKHYYDWGTFMTYWNVMDGMGLAVGPA
ncbi:MAG: C39 family peptidase [Thermomicrobiales bacterium]